MPNNLPIHEACQVPLDLDALRRELVNGVSPDVAGGIGYTPLHLLCGGATWGQLDARLAGIRLLITVGAAVDAVDDYGMRPLDYVSGYGRICLTLLRAGAALHAQPTGTCEK